jgi:hypothetical protein
MAAVAATAHPARVDRCSLLARFVESLAALAPLADYGAALLLLDDQAPAGGQATPARTSPDS